MKKKFMSAVIVVICLVSFLYADPWDLRAATMPLPLGTNATNRGPLQTTKVLSSTTTLAQTQQNGATTASNLNGTEVTTSGIKTSKNYTEAIWTTTKEDGETTGPKCSVTKCQVPKDVDDPTKGLKPNPFYRFCYKNMTSYENFLKYGQLPENQVLLNTTNLCKLTITSNTYVPGSNVRNVPLVLAEVVEDISNLTNGAPLPSDFRRYAWYEETETSVYWCTSNDPNISCNWKDHHIAMESHIRMVKSKKPPLGKLSYVNTCQTHLQYAGLESMLRNVFDQLCYGESGNAANDNNRNCYCDIDESCVVQRGTDNDIMVGCVSQLININDMKNTTLKDGTLYDPSVFSLCMLMSDTEFLTNESGCFLIDNGEKFYQVCCCGGGVCGGKNTTIPYAIGGNLMEPTT